MPIKNFLPKQKTPRGFALIEMLIYIIIFVLIALAIVNSLTYITKTYQTLKGERDLLLSAQTILNEITLEVRQAKSIDPANSLFSQPTSRLTVLGKDANNVDTKYEFYLSDGQIKLKENNVEKGSLTSDKVTVTEFTVYHLDNAISEGVTLNLILQAKNNPTRVRTFGATAMLRNVF